MVIYKPLLKDNKKKPKEDSPSAVDDCADVTSKHDRFKKDSDKPRFPPIDYEKPPHF